MPTNELTKSGMINRIAELAEKNERLIFIVEMFNNLICDETENIQALGIEEIGKRVHAVKISLQNHKETVKQNQSLQKSLNELKTRPFFPCPLNSGNRQDYGEFYLISHAWFSFLNTPQQIGIVEVEYKSDNHRAMYIGITNAVPTPEGFKASVLCIANYGQKIRDSREV